MSNTNNLTDYVLMPSADYQDMCNAIREKTGITGDIISSQIGNIIRSIQGSVVLPKHTVKFYNDTTLLQIYNDVVYGSTVAYTGETPTKAGTDTVSYTFIGFEPSGARITGDTNCYAQFVENMIEPDEPEVTYGWVPMAADGVSYTGETVTIPHANKVGISFEYVISETDQYRVTINGAEYTFSLGDKGMVQVAAEDNTVVNGLWVVGRDNIIHFQRYDGLTDVTATIKFESYVAIPSQPETTGKYVPFCADGTTWTGETLTLVSRGENRLPTYGYYYEGEFVSSEQYKATVNGTEYILTVGENGSDYTADGCPIMVVIDDYGCLICPNTSLSGDWLESLTFKLESYVAGSDEEEGYVPTAGYQAFTTDGTWTGEEVTTAYAPTINIDGTLYYRKSDIKYVGGTSLPIDNNTVILLTVDGVSYECHAVLTRDSKKIWYFASDGCPVALGGGYDVGDDNWWLAFASAGTYTVKVEVKI